MVSKCCGLLVHFPFFEWQIQTTAIFCCGQLFSLTQGQNVHASWPSAVVIAIVLKRNFFPDTTDVSWHHHLQLILWRWFDVYRPNVSLIVDHMQVDISTHYGQKTGSGMVLKNSWTISMEFLLAWGMRLKKDDGKEVVAFFCFHFICSISLCLCILQRNNRHKNYHRSMTDCPAGGHLRLYRTQRICSCISENIKLQRVLANIRTNESSLLF